MEEVVRAMRPRYFLASHSGHSTKSYLKLLRTVEDLSITAIQPTSRPRRIELGSVELTIFPQAARRPQGGEQQLGRHPAEVRGIFAPPAGRQRGPGAPMVARITSPSWCGIARSSSWPITAAAMVPTQRGSAWSVPSWPWPAWAGTTNSATLIPRRSACCDASRIPLLRTDQLGTITLQSDGRTWSVVRPALARRGRPTQGDIDQIANASGDDAPERTHRAERASGNRPCISTVLRRRQTAPSQPSAATPEAMIPSVDETLSVVAA